MTTTWPVEGFLVAPEEDPYFNIDALRKVVEWARKQSRKRISKREWEQGHWAIDWDVYKPSIDAGKRHYCGTTYCIAGKLVAEADLTGDRAGTTWDPFVDAKKVEARFGHREHAWSKVASMVLGAHWGETDPLFNANNTFADIEREATRLAASHGYLL